VEKELHAAFVMEMGSTAIWREYHVDAESGADALAKVR
jgi:hypothetical protein